MGKLFLMQQEVIEGQRRPVNLQLDYVWMPKKLQILNLSADFPHHVKAADLLPVQDLHCNFMASQFVFANYNRRIEKMLF